MGKDTVGLSFNSVILRIDVRHDLNKITLSVLALPGWTDKCCYIIWLVERASHHTALTPHKTSTVLRLGFVVEYCYCIRHPRPHTHTHPVTLHSCWPCDSSSKGYRWLHFVQAYRADVAILAELMSPS